MGVDRKSQSYRADARQRVILTRIIFYVSHFDSHAATAVIYSRFREHRRKKCLSKKVWLCDEGAVWNA